MGLLRLLGRIFWKDDSPTPSDIESLNKLINASRQQHEDWRIDRQIKQAANDWYFQHISAPVYILADGTRKRFYLYIPALTPGIYYVHDDESARYKNVHITKLIQEEFTKLLAERGDPNLDLEIPKVDFQKLNK